MNIPAAFFTAKYFQSKSIFENLYFYTQGLPWPFMFWTTTQWETHQSIKSQRKNFGLLRYESCRLDKTA